MYFTLNDIRGMIWLEFCFKIVQDTLCFSVPVIQPDGKVTSENIVTPYCTLHSALHLPVRASKNKELEGPSLQRLQMMTEGKQYILIDEMSMLGLETMGWVDRRLRQASGKLTETLGGFSVILVGDFGQLPPVGDRPMYAPGQVSVLGDQGHTSYKMFDKGRGAGCEQYLRVKSASIIWRGGSCRCCSCSCRCWQRSCARQKMTPKQQLFVGCCYGWEMVNRQRLTGRGSSPGHQAPAPRPSSEMQCGCSLTRTVFLSTTIWLPWWSLWHPVRRKQ